MHIRAQRIVTGGKLDLFALHAGRHSTRRWPVVRSAAA
jgi:hypothetical protein